jgi:hypothetical protein
LVLPAADGPLWSFAASPVRRLACLPLYGTKTAFVTGLI